MKSRIVLHSFESVSFELIVESVSDEADRKGGSRGEAYRPAGLMTPLANSPAIPKWIGSDSALLLRGSAGRAHRANGH